jgi:Lrp/AsnC family transcriptional regulator for asnA, asnC and gidA
MDNLDKSILHALMDNARVPYSELAKKFDVSAGTIHVRVEKMKNAKDYPDTIKRLDALDEVVEAYYTTGNYSIFIKVVTRSIDHLQDVLINKIQAIDAIQSTETLISLQNPINRDVTP